MPRPARKELTILVPAFDEEARLTTTVEEVLAAAHRHLDAFEVLIVDDGSRDGTGAIADDLARRHPGVRVFHQPANRGVGAAFHLGLAQARFAYLTLVPGDNAFHPSGLDRVFARVGRSDMIVTYRQNMGVRTPLRRLLSRCCTACMRLLTGRPLRDAHGMYVFPVAQARRLPVRSGYGYHIEALAALLGMGLSYEEVPVSLNPRPDASSKVLRPRVLAALAATMARLFLRRWLRRPFRGHVPPPSPPLPEMGPRRAA